jgi:hypothetical protein
VPLTSRLRYKLTWLPPLKPCPCPVLLIPSQPLPLLSPHRNLLKYAMIQYFKTFTSHASGPNSHRFLSHSMSQFSVSFARENS